MFVQRLLFRPIYALAVVLLLLLVACGSAAQQPAASSPDVAEPTTAAVEGEVIRIGFSAWPGWIPWQVAVEQGLFEANGVNVEMVWFEGYLDSLNALATGQLDGNTQTLNDTISSVAAGDDQVVVLVNDNSTGNDQVIVRTDINDVTDLAGKTIAAELGAVSHFLLLLGMEEAGLSADDITFQPMETGAAASAFAAGQVDGVAVFAPFTTMALSTDEGKVLFSSADFPGAIPDFLVVSRELVEERPDDVQRIVDTWYDTLDYIEANPDEAYAIMAKRAGVSVEEYREYDEGTTIFTVEDNLEAFTPGDTMAHLPYAAERIATFLLDNELIEAKPDLTNLFDDQFVQAHADQQSMLAE
ncbi:MAG: ABC transporter substrate-binding protein [Chloroflexaceae bacterium]|nr:ABC transporter substrate-binding protein [Chloroflexaceae bacterium]